MIVEYKGELITHMQAGAWYWDGFIYFRIEYVMAAIDWQIQLKKNKK